jgi:hypothetical protein
MDIITLQDIKSLVEIKDDYAISIFLNTHRYGKDTQQDPIRLRNLISNVEKQLLSEGLNHPTVQKILEPAQELLLQSGFWKHTSDGLVIYISSGIFKAYRLPIEFDELIVISTTLHLKPLLPYFARDGHFYVLALSQNLIRFFEGTRYTVDEIFLEETLPNLAEGMKSLEFSKELQFHTGTSDKHGGLNAAVFHGHDPSDDDVKRLLNWFHKVDKALASFLADEKSPLVLAGVDHLIPLFRKASTYQNIVEENISGNPDQWSTKEIHEKALPIIEPIFKKDKNAAIEKYQNVKSNQLTSNAIDEVIFYAHQGRIDTLFIADGEKVWGTFDLKKQTLKVHREQNTGDHDLLNISAVQTMLNGGDVYVVASEKVPDGSQLAAILRY